MKFAYEKIRYYSAIYFFIQYINLNKCIHHCFSISRTFCTIEILFCLPFINQELQREYHKRHIQTDKQGKTLTLLLAYDLVKSYAFFSFVDVDVYV